jgi:hypothetical protein
MKHGPLTAPIAAAPVQGDREAIESAGMGDCVERGVCRPASGERARILLLSLLGRTQTGFIAALFIVGVTNLAWYGFCLLVGQIP